MQFVLLLLVPSLSISENNLALISVHPFIRHFKTVSSAFSEGWTNPVVQSLLISRVLQSPELFDDPPSDSHKDGNVFLVLRSPQAGTAAHLQIAQRGSITSLHLLATLLLTQPDMFLATLAVGAHCWPVFILYHSWTPGFPTPFLQSCFLVCWCQTCIGVQCYSA